MVKCFYVFLFLQKPSWSTYYATWHSSTYRHFWEPWHLTWSISPNTCFWIWQLHLWNRRGFRQPIKHYIWRWKFIDWWFWIQHIFWGRFWSHLNFRSRQPNCWKQEEQTLSTIRNLYLPFATCQCGKELFLKTAFGMFLPGLEIFL